jgi:acetylornithine deacetylase
VRDAADSVLGAPPPIAGASYWADAAFIAAAGIPTVMFGPGGEGAHAAEEWVSIAETAAVARTLVAVAERLCR